jgi:pantoate--beta-alanine ligase
MGGLHEGHAALIKRARTLADRVVTSIFVNPLQFGPNEDFTRYPRTPVEDAALLQSLQVDVLFAPEVADMYPHGQRPHTIVDVPDLSSTLCGEFRPGHFQGVATVVTKLLNIVQPDIAVFGKKDFQQLVVIRRTVEDLCMPVEIVGEPTVREPDGLAMSSRNRYLSTEERRAAPAIYATLQAAQQAINSGQRDFLKLEELGAETLIAHGLRPDYFAIRDATTLQAPTPQSRQFVILTAARIGKTRLIDNVVANGPAVTITGL